MSATAPPELPVPKDDGACAHLTGTWLASVPLPSTSGERIDLSRLPGRVVIYCYPMTGKPGIPLPPGWAEIPGAMGCTPEACGFRDHAAELAGLDARVFGISTQTTEEQLEAKERLKLPYALLSDERLDFVRSLRLPTFDAAGPGAWFAIRHQNHRPFDKINEAYMPSFFEYDAGLSYTWGPARLAFVARNIGNSRHYVAESEIGDAQNYVAPPRRFLGEVTVRF